ncbi:bromodomain adjacent to zinc finger domain protein 1A isoform X2 [Anoplophora glabripennis]|uniref:bromodomain adjacent to zinc finger domain protein 1A isoform X2 n=1 Tax=Anoplophora glabripennis TaxID=217634 RepID=UPI000874A9B3|nr:bromodomain adjacent to zinc finger domain protein 1A isoform X2 [Anoplophora glabripennis]
MPLLKKKVFEKQSIPDFLRDDEEVFYCEITNEIFRDYEEFSERMFLCNSMVWTCSMTGKSNLTYQEALESEENAKQSLKEFPIELRIPILFLASKTQRSSFGDMAEDVFMYAKDRYFIGENLETSFTGNKWKDSHVLQVIAPTEEQLGSINRNGTNSDRHYWPPANLFKYEIEHLDADDNDISEIMIVDCNQIRRKKGVFNREKSKLFLKQYVEQDEKGMFVIKTPILEDFGINKMKFDQIFDGPLPNFDKSKRLEKIPNGKKQKQETLAKYLMKNNTTVTSINIENKLDAKQKKYNLLEQMKKREEEFKVWRQMKEEEKLALKKKQKEESLKIASYLKEWNKIKDDLDLEDQKKLPVPMPVKSKVPDKYFGDMLMVMEFVETFSKLLSTKDFFPSGFTLEIMERALIEKEVAGPLTDIIQMFLTALFNLQDEESTQYRTSIENTTDIKEEELPDNLSLTEATRLATLASSWSNKYQGLPLGRLPLYSVTVSEILRLHLLSSGARINDTGAKWRYAQRGGYTSEDDPGLHLRLHQPHILKALAFHNVVQLPISDKLQILACLTNQLLTYADVRDIVEERLEKIKQLKMDLKVAQAAERKKEQEYATGKWKLQKEMKDRPEARKEAVEKLKKEADKRRAENARKADKLMKAICDLQNVMGYDRAYRKYIRLDSVPAVFVNSEDKYAGECRQEICKQNSELVNVDRKQLLKHVRKVLFEEMNSSDKENEPSKSLKKGNGSPNSSSSAESESCAELLMCSADPTTCIVHSTDLNRNRWFFFHSKEQLEALEISLNKRGVRESELLHVIINDKDRLMNVITQTPVSVLNPDVEIDEEQKPLKNAKKGKDRYEDANLGYGSEMAPEEVLENALVDNILEMEEKIYAGNLGGLAVKNRDEWRNCLLSKRYEDLNRSIMRNGENGKLIKVRKEKGKNSRSCSPELPKSELKDYQDPGRFLGTVLDVEVNGVDGEGDDVILVQVERLQKAIGGLALALGQVAQAVDQKYLKKPLGHADATKNDKKKDVLDKWEQSLLASTSFSQVFLHYGTLDSCVMWSRSALLARCRICRRQKDSENMLLCDNCNLGHHLYCLKPKLTVVPKGDWFCDRCKREKEKEAKLLSPEPMPQKKRRIFRDEDVEEEEEDGDGGGSGEENEMAEEESEEEIDGGVDEEEQNGDIKVELCKMCGSGGELLTCEKCSLNYHIECCVPPLRRAPRGSWLCYSCKETKDRYRESDSGDEVVHSRRSHRREEGRGDLPLHNAALQELLSEVMKHKDAWAFLRPVQKNEVPDYYDVITRPMDFGTIKYKLNMGEYNEDSQLMQDAVLIFENCNTYNHSDAEVYKCGVRLLKFFEKKAKELGLKLPEEMESDPEEQPKSKKRRTK